PAVDDERKVGEIARHVQSIIDLLGLDPREPNLVETPVRVAKMYLEMFRGLSEGAEPSIKCFPNEERYQAMVMEKDIPFYSLCSHHFVPFYGRAHIAYIPTARIVGLSELPRILGCDARRPQLPSRHTAQGSG